MEGQFKSFIDKYGKEYSTREEYVHRLGIFTKNLARDVEHQALDPTAVHGITQFSDLTEEEFEGMYMGMRGGGPKLLEGGVYMTVRRCLWMKMGIIPVFVNVLWRDL